MLMQLLLFFSLRVITTVVEGVWKGDRAAGEHQKSDDCIQKLPNKLQPQPAHGFSAAQAKNTSVAVGMEI